MTGTAEELPVAAHHLRRQGRTDIAGPRIARKHIGWYLEGIPGCDDARRTFNQLQTPQTQIEFLEALLSNSHLQDLAA